ncbi:c-type cytochrome biogenesis protein CcmI [Elioraea sp.]|uniref:c-type cytochrome biogenesis protein CcmI n=1 Tax=Elioraea sp. TaxID=2185103 RepID=UPI0025C4090A|nr:c-type cytochrome biogenesis protein CcmI [Elioraea sp.]
MLTWIILGVATFAALLTLLWPALRGVRAYAPRAAHDTALYRAQLTELERERAEGRLSEQEHREATLEVQRRLLAAASEVGEAAAPTPRADRWLLLGTAIALPSLALMLYLPRGMPDMPAFPFAVVEAERQAENAAAEVLIARVRERINTFPAGSDEARQGWVLLAGVERRRGNISAAIGAYRQALTIRFEPELAADLAEVLSIAADGSVTDEALALLRRAAAADPGDLRIRYYLSAAALERGNAQLALDGFRAVKAATPPDSPVRAMVAERIAEAETRLRAAGAAGPSPEQMAAASELPAEQRQLMISAMVDRLADRLRSEPNDAEGWLRLAHAYRILGRGMEARGALDRAAALLPDDPRVVAEKMAQGRGG